MVGRLAIFPAFPNRQLLPHRRDCTFQSLYHPHIPEIQNLGRFSLEMRAYVLSFKMKPIHPRKSYP
jgi:hypothetical protein